MKIGIVQPTSKDSAIRNAEKALQGGSQVVLLPEKWVKSIDELPLTDLQRLAVRYTAFIIPGAVEDEVSVISPVISPRGQILGLAKKIHLFGREKGRLLPGTSATYFSANGVKIGVVICYDLDFPEVARSLLLKGVEIILVPSKIRRDGMDRWRDYVRMRSLENRIAVVNANAVEIPNFAGGSIAVVPYKRGDIVDLKVVAEMGEEDGYTIADIDPISYLQIRLERMKEIVQFSVEELDSKN
ncbi:carbon-nitrogen hydrolase family protein [Metallosphaera tengchongensis]|uniref:Carbon-nitrogen hydrolase family protein n=1 Tax=Metallosphaera tengchongensis TaxID=1532350 RepID=A0A6N0NU64_9CREN|nr:carbon-nitrogen hydrolase family protein [Metallosphaera tengchongensis]QKR00326.1 carbon-nitrogen hydrolase family protein [Metallosphaera tengchongensis]